MEAGCTALADDMNEENRDAAYLPLLLGQPFRQSSLVLLASLEVLLVVWVLSGVLLHATTDDLANSVLSRAAV